jgi:hypothetical protein
VPSAAAAVPVPQNLGSEKLEYALMMSTIAAFSFCALM